MDALTDTPRYTFGLRPDINKPNNVPAPGTYSPEKNVDSMTDTPRYTFGLKPDLNKPNNVPGNF